MRPIQQVCIHVELGERRVDLRLGVVQPLPTLVQLVQSLSPAGTVTGLEAFLVVDQASDLRLQIFVLLVDLVDLSRHVYSLVHLVASNPADTPGSFLGRALCLVNQHLLQVGDSLLLVDDLQQSFHQLILLHGVRGGAQLGLLLEVEQPRLGLGPLQAGVQLLLLQVHLQGTSTSTDHLFSGDVESAVLLDHVGVFDLGDDALLLHVAEPALAPLVQAVDVAVTARVCRVAAHLRLLLHWWFLRWIQSLRG